MHCEPAAQIIQKFGSPLGIAKALGVDVSRVHRWRLPPSQGGTGGSIPQKHIPALMIHAMDIGIELELEDFFPEVRSARERLPAQLEAGS